MERPQALSESIGGLGTVLFAVAVILVWYLLNGSSQSNEKTAPSGRSYADDDDDDELEEQERLRRMSEQELRINSPALVGAPVEPALPPQFRSVADDQGGQP